MADLVPIHPGEILAEEFLKPHGLTAYAAARLMHVPRTRIERLVAGKTPVTPDTALRLERLLGPAAEFWLTLQARFDVETARDGVTAELDKIERFKAA